MSDGRVMVVCGMWGGKDVFLSFYPEIVFPKQENYKTKSAILFIETVNPAGDYNQIFKCEWPNH